MRPTIYIWIIVYTQQLSLLLQKKELNKAGGPLPSVPVCLLVLRLWGMRPDCEKIWVV